VARSSEFLNLSVWHGVPSDFIRAEICNDFISGLSIEHTRSQKKKGFPASLLSALHRSLCRRTITISAGAPVLFYILTMATTSTSPTEIEHPSHPLPVKIRESYASHSIIAPASLSRAGCSFVITKKRTNEMNPERKQTLKNLPLSQR
jgi:hypothetical protein